jgi:formiminotetrahydrofolate cyclodeaminase
MAGSTPKAPNCSPGLEEFVRSVAGVSPLLPGGGSVAALAGSLAAALGEMMSGVTEGREKFAAVDLQVREIHAKLAKLRGMLWALIEEDSAAFYRLMDVLKLPRNTEAQRAIRTDAIEKALREATDTPMRTARASFEILENIGVLIDIGNQSARCDAAVGAQMAFASLKSAHYNVFANTSGLKDKAFGENCRSEVLKLVQRGQAMLHQIDRKITGP